MQCVEHTSIIFKFIHGNQLILSMAACLGFLYACPPELNGFLFAQLRLSLLKFDGLGLCKFQILDYIVPSFPYVRCSVCKEELKASSRVYLPSSVNIGLKFFWSFLQLFFPVVAGVIYFLRTCFFPFIEAVWAIYFEESKGKLFECSVNLICIMNISTLTIYIHKSFFIQRLFQNIFDA